MFNPQAKTYGDHRETVTVSYSDPYVQIDTGWSEDVVWLSVDDTERLALDLLDRVAAMRAAASTE
jgi:hypothetical protein